MPSKPTDQEANTCFDEHLTLRDQHTDQAAGPNCFENNVENSAFQDDFQLQVSDDSDERRNKLAKANNLSSGQAVLSTKTNIDAKQRSSSIIDASNLYIEPSEHSLTESTSPNSNIPKSNKTVLENCYYSNHVHIGSVHKSEKKSIHLPKMTTNRYDERKYQLRKRAMKLLNFLKKALVKKNILVDLP